MQYRKDAQSSEMQDMNCKYVVIYFNNTLQIPRDEIVLISEFDEGMTQMTKMGAAFNCIQHTAYSI